MSSVWNSILRRGLIKGGVMTNIELEDLFKQASLDSSVSALRAIWNAGYYSGSGKTPVAGGTDFSIAAVKPSVLVLPIIKGR